MNKYKAGDKFVIEIEEIYSGPLTKETDHLHLYRVKGFNSLVFDEYGLGKLEQIKETKEAPKLKRYIDDCDICYRCPDKKVRCSYDCDFPDFLTSKMEFVINEQPTAYDLDEIVRQLEEEAHRERMSAEFRLAGSAGYNEAKNIAKGIDRAIEIVKGGQNA